MKLAGFDLFRYELPLTEPVRVKGATLHRREGILLSLTDEGGNAGWGEAAPLPGFSRESIEEAARQLEELSGSLLESEPSPEWWSPNGASLPWSNHENLCPSVRFALELAAWNLLAAPTDGTPLKLAERPTNLVPVNGLLSVSTENTLEEALSMAETGYRAVKLKVGGCEVAWEARLVRDVGEAVGRDVGLRLDANRAWSFEEAVGFGRGVAGVGVEYVEEPLSEPGRLAELSRGWGLPVALDESLVGMEPGELGGHDYARAIVLKPTLLGGISRTLSLAERALRLGMTPVVSSSYESGVGTAALVALAAAVGDEPAPAGLDTYRRLAEDVILEPLKLPAPFIDVRLATDAARKVDVRRLEPLRMR